MRNYYTITHCYHSSKKAVEKIDCSRTEKRVRLIVKWAERRMHCLMRRDRAGLLQLAEEIARHGKCALGLAAEVKREAACL